VVVGRWWWQKGKRRNDSGIPRFEKRETWGTPCLAAAIKNQDHTKAT